MQPITPKPTRYKGTTFRSRLEARWAVFLDRLPAVLSWEYEPLSGRVLDLSTGWTYKADFLVEVLIPGTSTKVLYYLEVKPHRPTADYIHILEMFSRLLKHPLFIAAGNFYDINLEVYGLHADKRLKPNIPNLFGLQRTVAYEAACQYRFDLEESDGRKTRVPKAVRQGRGGEQPRRRSGKGNGKWPRPGSKILKRRKKRGR